MGGARHTYACIVCVSIRSRIALTRHAPEVAVRIRSRNVCAHSGVARAFIQLEHARMRRGGHIQGCGAIQETLRLVVHLREERVRIE